MSIFWIVVAVAMGILEAVTAQMVSIWFAIGAAAGYVTSLFTDNIYIQIAVAIVVTGITLVATRPLAKRIINNTKTHTNSDKNIGKTAVVTIEIDNYQSTGQVKVGSSVWSAKSADDSIIEKDSKVIVKDIEGVKLVVEKIS